MKKKIAIVIANYYPEISQMLLKGVIKEIQQNNNYDGPIYVPGIFEIPVVIAKNINKYDAFIALGCVIKGKTPHFDFISSACANSISRLTIKKKFPIIFGVLTTNTYKQALKRSQQKGMEIADAMISSINTYKQIKSKKS